MISRHLLAAVSLFLLSLTQIARADLTYTYTGNPFNYFDGSLYQPGDSVQGSITFNDSGSFDPYTGLTFYDNIVNYSFTDGVFDYTFANADNNTSAYVEVDAQGRVVVWGLFLDTYVPNGVYTLVTTNAAPRGFMDDFGEFYRLSPDPLVEYGEVDYDPGTWSGPNAVAPTPELSTLTLLGTGMLGAGSQLWKRRRSS